MVLRSWGLRHPDEPQPAEIRSVLDVRLQALAAATGEGRLDGPLPVRWRVGWKAFVRWHGRDRDGSMRASVSVRDPQGVEVYVRKVRLIKEQSIYFYSS